MTLTEEQKKIVDIFERKLKDRKKVIKCPLCGEQENFILGEYYTHQLVSEKTNHLNIGGGKTLPCASIVCTHCGFVMNISLAILGLLNEDENGKKK